jgi:hypothetical protein
MVEWYWLSQRQHSHTTNVTNYRINFQYKTSVWFQELTKYQQHEQQITSKAYKSEGCIVHKIQTHSGSKSFDWADRDLYGNAGEGKADSPVMWSRPNLLQPAHMTKTVVLKRCSKRSKYCIEHCRLGASQFC